MFWTCFGYAWDMCWICFGYVWPGWLAGWLGWPGWPAWLGLAGLAGLAGLVGLAKQAWLACPGWPGLAGVLGLPGWPGWLAWLAALAGLAAQIRHKWSRYYAGIMRDSWFPPLSNFRKLHAFRVAPSLPPSHPPWLALLASLTWLACGLAWPGWPDSP